MRLRSWSRCSSALARRSWKREQREERSRVGPDLACWLLAVPAAVTIASPAGAATAWAVVSFENAPPVAVGSLDLSLTFDAATLSPVLAGNPTFPTLVDPIVCAFEPPSTPCESAAGAAVDLPSANAIAPGVVDVALLSVSGLEESGDVFAIAFQTTGGGPPNLALVVESVTDPATLPIPPGQRPVITVRFVPEPAAGALGAAVAVVTLALRRRLGLRRRSE